MWFIRPEYKDEKRLLTILLKLKQKNQLLKRKS
ncbi:hypothetical protein CoNPh16_CDS0107 [Staphylococcus phage S-CoN_Ph16]|nr:hypothetical protein CoNPh16_CDS0107 [Staphylococcus phage S-CoN_Ph16]